MTDAYKQMVQKLYFWQYRRTDCFSDMLFDLIAKADPINRIKLAQGFPDHVKVYTDWYNAPTSEDFFGLHGFERLF